MTLLSMQCVNQVEFSFHGGIRNNEVYSLISKSKTLCIRARNISVF